MTARRIRLKQGERAVLVSLYKPPWCPSHDTFTLVPRLFGKAEWTAKIPFGPYLAGGAVLWVFYGPQWLNWYLDRTTLQ